VKATIGYFRGDFKSVPEALKAAFSGVFDIISEPFNKAFAWVGDKWESLKSAFGFGPKIEIPKPVVAGTPLRSRARGGMYSAPTVTEFAERGPEVAVPVGLADRGLGLSNLKIAARALGLGDMKAGAPDAGTTALDRGLRAPNAKEKAGRAPDKINVTISCDPQISIIANGSSQEEVRRAAIEALREFGAKMIPEWREQIARTAYVTG
jgi:hypothetical protein